MIDGIAVEDDELQRPRQFKDAFDFGLHLSDAVRARITALHQRSFRWIVEQRAFRQRNVGAYARNYDPANPIQRTNTCIYIHFKQLQQLQQHTNIHVATRASADKTESRAEANPHGRWIECIRTSVASQKSTAFRGCLLNRSRLIFYSIVPASSPPPPPPPRILPPPSSLLPPSLPPHHSSPVSRFLAPPRYILDLITPLWLVD